REDDFDRDAAACAQMICLVDDPHAAGAQPAPDRVSPVQSGADQGVMVGLGHERWLHARGMLLPAGRVDQWTVSTSLAGYARAPRGYGTRASLLTRGGTSWQRRSSARRASPLHPPAARSGRRAALPSST